MESRLTALIFLTGIRTYYVILLLTAEVSCQVITVDSGSHFGDWGEKEGRINLGAGA